MTCVHFPSEMLPSSPVKRENFQNAIEASGSSVLGGPGCTPLRGVYFGAWDSSPRSTAQGEAEYELPWCQNICGKDTLQVSRLCKVTSALGNPPSRYQNLWRTVSQWRTVVKRGFTWSPGSLPVKHSKQGDSPGHRTREVTVAKGTPKVTGLCEGQ